MTNESQVQLLLDELADSNATPEVVCHGHPELLEVVKKRWQKMLRIQADLDALFPPPNAPTPPAGEEAVLPQVPGYEVDKVLGHGGMGIVFQARHVRLNRLVALKMALVGTFAGTRERDRFQREAEAVARLRHPNVVQIYDVGDCGNRPYFTMELVDAGSLAQKLAGTPLPAQEAARLTAILAGAVQAAHSCGIVHRDLKPANVLLAGDGTPKISDFGLARCVDENAGLTQTGVAMGTPSYMAPEQARGQIEAIGPAADVYALGALLYEMLTGRPPFRGATGAETVQQVIEQDPVPPSRLNAKVPRDLQTVCLKCLQKDPHARYPSAVALEEDLNRFLRGEAVSARPEGWMGWMLRRIRRRPKQAAVLAISVVLSLFAIGAGGWLLSERASVARVAAARQVAIEQAAAQDLDDMVKSLRKSAWPAAEAALERAKARLGELRPKELNDLIVQGARDLALQRKLDELRLACDSLLEIRADSAPIDRPSTASFDHESEAEFHNAGFGRAYDDPKLVAVRIKASNISEGLIDALDHWGSVTRDDRLRKWLFNVAQLADDDPTGWRNRVRDDSIANDKQTLLDLASSVNVEDHRPPALLILSRRLVDARIDSESYIRRVQKAHPGDVWVNVRLTAILMLSRKTKESMGFMRVVLALRPESSMFHITAALILIELQERDEAIYHLRRACALEPDAMHVRRNAGVMLSKLGLHEEALTQLSKATEAYPDFEPLRRAYGKILLMQGRETEALTEVRKVAELAPQDFGCQQQLWQLELKLNHLEDARASWAKALDFKPVKHDYWYGYAEYCLYLGNQAEYLRARKDLLQAFGSTEDPRVAERTGRTCLLYPLEGEELDRAVALTELAANADRTIHANYYSYFQFARGLAMYRQGRFDQAIKVMRGDAAKVLGPAPKFVVAMSLHKTDHASPAQSILGEAIQSREWKPIQGYEPTLWVYQILRREAEELIGSKAEK